MRRLALLTALAIALPLAAAEPWVDAYNKGVAAVNQSNYKYAATELRKAIAEMPSEGVGVKTRAGGITYVPHFFLGIAKFNLGDVDGALREWETSEKQGAIGRTEYYATMKNWVSRAQAEKKRLAQKAASGGKSAAADAIATAALAQSEALAANADRTDNYRSAVRLLSEANTKYSRGGTDIATYAEAAQIATRATSLFAAATEEAKKQKAARQVVPKKKDDRPTEVVVPFIDEPATTTTTATKVEPKVEPKIEPETPVVSQAEADATAAVMQYRRNLGTANRASRGNSDLQTYLKRATGDAEKLRRRLEDAKSDTDFRNISQMVEALEDGLAKRIADSKTPAEIVPVVKTPDAPVVKPSEALGDAWRAFASGDFATSEALLTKVLGERPLAEAYLLRGCARYTRAMLSRAADAQRSGAVEDFRAALQQNRALRLDSRTFSPKLIAFFEDVRRGL